MSVKLNSIGGGSVTLQEPNTASALIATLPAQNGTLAMRPTSTYDNASGSSVDFTSIPDWVTRITMSLRAVSFAATGSCRVRLGISSGLVTTGYSTQFVALQTTPAISMSTVTDGISGFSTNDGTTSVNGIITITKIGSLTNWVATGSFSRASDSTCNIANGQVALGGTLDRISLVATTSTFDAGQVSIMYE